MSEPRLFVLLLCYAACSFTYAKLCGIIGNQYSPLAAFQVYAVAIPCWFALGSLLYSLRQPLPRMWPPRRLEVLQAAAATLILASETLALLMPASLVAVVAAKGGSLAFPDPRDRRPLREKMRLAALVILAVALAALHKPLRLLLVPLLVLAPVYVLGQRLKLRAVRAAKGDDGAKPGFFGAGQVVVNLLTVFLAILASLFAPHAPFTDWRLWLVALGSLGCGLFGLRLMLHRTAEGIVYPAYRAASLLCALAASREPLDWSGWLAAGIALCVVLWASAEAELRAALRWCRLTAVIVLAELGSAQRELEA